MGLYLQKLRKSKNLSQADIAVLCNVSHQAVSKWEKGESVPDIAVLQILSEYYKITINEILSGKIVKVKKRDNDFNRQIIGLTVSCLGFLVFFLPFITIDVLKSLNIWGINTITNNNGLTGYGIIFNINSGSVLLMTGFLFLMLICNIVYTSFLLGRVIIVSEKKLLANRAVIFIYLLICITNVIINFNLLPQFLLMLIGVVLLIINILDCQKYGKIQVSNCVRKNNKRDFIITLIFNVIIIFVNYYFIFEDGFLLILLCVMLIFAIFNNVLVYIFIMKKIIVNTKLILIKRYISFISCILYISNIIYSMVCYSLDVYKTWFSFSFNDIIIFFVFSLPVIVLSLITYKTSTTLFESINNERTT